MFFIRITDDYRLCVAPNKYSPYEDRFAGILLKIVEYGIMRHLKVIARMELKLARLAKAGNALHDSVLSLSDLKYGFLVYTIGIITATIAFLIEIIIFKIRMEHNRFLFLRKKKTNV